MLECMFIHVRFDDKERALSNKMEKIQNINMENKFLFPYLLIN